MVCQTSCSLDSGFNDVHEIFAEGTWSCNFPLRGGKNTIWEGGTRVVGMVAGPGVAQGATLTLPVHATDWLPSLVSMATGGEPFTKWAPLNEPPYLPGDGLDVWNTIATAGSNGSSPRDWVLLEAHAIPRPQVRAHLRLLPSARPHTAANVDSWRWPHSWRLEACVLG